MVFFAVLSLMLFMLGAMVGSFLNVLIYRTLDQDPLKRHESWVTGRSRCDHCHHQIAWFDNVPLLSYLVLQGKCRNCHTPIDASHPVVELLVGTLFVWWFWGGSLFFQLTQQPMQTLQPLFWLLVAVLLLVITVADVRYWIIPDWAVGLLSLLTITYRLVLVASGIMRPVDMASTLLVSFGAVLFFVGLWLATKRQGIGLGDVKLIFPLGLLLGWPNTVVAIFLAFLLGALIGMVLIANKKRSLKQAIPFGPFLIIASCVSLLWGDHLVSWYLTLLH